ncbi:MAG TPA: hypothetical protein VJQ57_08170 [Acidimicrobiia bacterium]|nr:hypothetical protein [Acidimicrobiia bacterium]
MALSGVAFGALLLVGWFLSGGDTPDYTAADSEWTDWAASNQSRSGIGGFVILLAGYALLHYAGVLREQLGTAEIAIRGSAPLTNAAFAGAITGAVGIAMAIVMIGAATAVGGEADPVVSRAVGTASAGPYLVATMGFATLLGASGLLTMRTGIFPRWTGAVALIGAVAFLVVFITLLQGTGEDSVFGYGYLPGILSLVLWTIATSTKTYRGLTRRTIATSVRS